MDVEVLAVIECPDMEVLPVRSTFEDTYRQEFPGLLAVATVFTGDRRDGDAAEGLDGPPAVGALDG